MRVLDFLSFGLSGMGLPSQPGFSWSAGQPNLFLRLLASCFRSPVLSDVFRDSRYVPSIPLGSGSFLLAGILGGQDGQWEFQLLLPLTDRQEMDSFPKPFPIILIFPSHTQSISIPAGDHLKFPERHVVCLYLHHSALTLLSCTNFLKFSFFS